MHHDKPITLVLPVAFALLWGTTYATAQIGLEFISPAFFVAFRLTLAAAFMIVLVRFGLEDKLPTGANLVHLLIGGGLVHAVTLTPAHIALVTVQAAPLALVHAFHPVLTAAIAAAILNERFSARQWLGMALGMIGVALAFPFATTQWPVIGLVALSLFGLTGGTLYLKRFVSGVEAFPSTAVQLAGGAVASVLAVALFEIPEVAWEPPLIASMIWNIVMVSIVGMVIYTLMLARGQAGRAASAFFIVPGFAALLAWGILDQTLNPLALTGLAIASFGVWLVWWRTV